MGDGTASSHRRLLAPGRPFCETQKSSVVIWRRRQRRGVSVGVFRKLTPEVRHRNGQSTFGDKGRNSPPWQRRGERAIKEMAPKATFSKARTGWFVQTNGCSCACDNSRRIASNTPTK